MEKTIKIKPVNYSIDTLEIINVGVELGKFAYVNCIIKGDNITINNTIDITEEEYTAWGSDDDYIVDLLLSKLSLEKA